MKLINLLTNKFQTDTLAQLWSEVKWLMHYVAKYHRAILYYIGLGVLGTAMGLAGSVASKYLIDAVTGHNSSNIKFIIMMMISMFLGNTILGAATSRLSARISLKVKNEIQAEVYDRIMSTDWEAVSAYHSGDLLNRFGSDVGILADSVLGWFPSLVTRSLQFIGILIIIVYYDSTLAVIALISAPVTFLMSKLLMSRMRDYNKKMRQFSSEMMAFQEESFQNLQIIKSFDLLNYFGQRLRAVQKRYSEFALDYNLFSIYTSSFLSFIGMGVGLATFGWGVYRLWSGFISYGTMTLFLQLSGGLSGGFSSLIELVPAAISATTSAGRIMAVVELPREKRLASAGENGGPEEKNHDLEVRLSQVNFGYHGFEVLGNISLCARPRELTAIIGPSGEGKTTLLHIILGLLNPGSGEVKLFDKNNSQFTVSAATRRFFAYVPQGNSIFSGTIADNLRLVKPEATQEELFLALKAACAYDFIQALPEGIDTEVGEKGFNFSEGQVQRISIARALLRNAPILLLDEATSALDTETEKLVLQSILNYGVTHTCILTSHRPSIIDLCDRIYRIDHTQIYEIVKEMPLDAGVNN